MEKLDSGSFKVGLILVEWIDTEEGGLLEGAVDLEWIVDNSGTWEDGLVVNWL